MTKTQISIKVPAGELESILARLDAARAEIYQCYQELGALGYVELIPEPEASEQA